MKNNLRIERARLRLTQEGLANAVNVSRQTIVAIERGDYIPSTALALRLAKFLQKKVEELFELEESDLSGKPN